MDEMTFEQEVDNWEDLKSNGDSYAYDSDIDLYCEDLGKLRLMNWGVI